MAFGITPEGFVLKRLADISAEVDVELKIIFGPNINLLPESVLGQIRGIFSERESLIWELAQATYNSQYPDTAAGINLDNVVSITGIERRPPTFSTVGLTLFGIAGTIVPTNSQVSLSTDPSVRFLTDESSTILAAVDEVQKLNFSNVPDSGSFAIDFDGQTTGLILFSDGAAAVETALELLSNIDGVTVTGDFTLGFTITFDGALVGGQDQPLFTIVTNTLFLGATPVAVTPVESVKGALAQSSVGATADVLGSINANSGTVTVIDTPVAGWSSVTNPIDAVPGLDIETDAELRSRRNDTLQISGAATVDAIRAELLTITGVSTAIVFENNTFIVDVGGRPPKSFEAVVVGGTNEDIAQKIWDTKAAGISSFGSVSEVVIDSQGFSQTVSFSRATSVPIWLELDLSTDVSFPIDGVTQTVNAILAYGEQLLIGEDVIVIPDLICALNEITGLLNVVVRVGIAPSPTLSSNIAIAIQEIAEFDSSRILVAVV